MQHPFDNDTMQKINECRSKFGHSWSGVPKKCSGCGINRRTLQRYGLANGTLSRPQPVTLVKRSKARKRPQGAAFVTRDYDGQHSEVDLDNALQ